MAGGLRYLSVCSGIEAATVAWHPLGWTPSAFSEIEAFPRAVLAHHYPDVPCHGDFTTIGADDYGPIDLLVGGTPCQSFSVAGLRGGMADDRGNLALEYLRLAHRKRPRWLVWENVPGVLSSSEGRDFGSFLGALVELGYGFAYRVLDAQFFGVAQRRRRVFVVGYLGDWRSAVSVLFERHSLQGHSTSRREKGKAAPTIPSRNSAGGGLGTDFDCDGGLVANTLSSDEGGISPNKTYVPMASTGDVSHCLNAGGMSRQDYETETLIAAIQERATSENPDAGPDGAGFRDDGAAYTLEARSVPQAVAFQTDQSPEASADLAFTLTTPSPSGGGQPQSVMAHSAVRRLTPRECERLQGFPDDYTLVPYRGKPASDGPRYKALGNSMAVPVMRWIGERIALVEALQTQAEAA